MQSICIVEGLMNRLSCKTSLRHKFRFEWNRKGKNQIIVDIMSYSLNKHLFFAFFFSKFRKVQKKREMNISKLGSAFWYQNCSFFLWSDTNITAYKLKLIPKDKLTLLFQYFLFQMYAAVRTIRDHLLSENASYPSINSNIHII